MTRLATRLLTVLALVAGGLLIPAAASLPAPTAQAADLAVFVPGHIIADAVFYDSRAMDAGEVQAFHNAKGSSCKPGTDGTPCIKNYTVSTGNRSADGLCNGYQGAANETAATVIAKVAVSCGVNPRVLLVLLQKEMGLITGTQPTAKKYERAAGYACPDSANGGCDPTYAGLMNQLYRSGWQNKRYQAYPSSYSFRAGRDNTIGWHPNTACGSSTVYIANQATAGLYNYTPYRPNQSALNAGYGTGDSCSSYGNRNFWNYFTDWFGSTQSFGASAIFALYNTYDGESGWLGQPTSGYLCGQPNGGCAQVYVNGVIYWSPASGAHAVHGAIRTHWDAHRNAYGWLGYPVTEEQCGLVNSGCWQQFQNGAIYWSPASAAYSSRGAIRDKWGTLAFENSFLGYPTSDEQCGLVDKGCWQKFQYGVIYWSSASGTHYVLGAIRDFWNARSNVQSIGYPLTDEQCGLVDGGCWQQFQNGAIYWSSATGAHFNAGAIRAAWGTSGFENGVLGYPAAEEECGLAANGCRQQFENGTIYWSSASGAHLTYGPIQQHWDDNGGLRGFHGYPVTDLQCGLASGGCGQQFQNGAIYSSPASGTFFIRGAIRDRWTALGSDKSTLGYPTSDEICTGATGCHNTFQNGALTWSPSAGVTLIGSSVYASWTRLGGSATLGSALTDTRCGLAESGCSQQFQWGTLYWAPATGGFFVHGAILDVYTTAGAERSALGYPTSDETCGLAAGGCRQQFQNGAVYWSPTSGAHAVSGNIAAAWANQGREAGSWGYPTGDAQTTASGVSQRFAGGTARFDSTTGTVTFN